MTAAWQLQTPHQNMLNLILTCTETSVMMGRDAWHPATRGSMMVTCMCLVHYKVTRQAQNDTGITVPLSYYRSAWQLISTVLVQNDLRIILHWSPTAWHQTPWWCFLRCNPSERCYALNAAFRLASSRIKLGGYSEDNHRCLTGRRGTGGERRCLTGREEAHFQPHLCKQTHEGAKP